MCVIFVADKTRPTEEMVEQAYRQNSSGGGVAWRENGLVHWRKGLTLEEMKELNESMPFPFVEHYRIPTCGGAIPELCHPFPIQRDAPLHIHGSTKGWVLFHNGHWGRWKDTILDFAKGRNVKIPEGKWSDSRAMAWCASFAGIPLLEMIDEKIFAFSPTRYELFGQGWTKEGDVYCSNTHWKPHQGSTGSFNRGSYTYTMCRERSCHKNKETGSEYCSDHQHLDTVRHPIILGDGKNTTPKAGGTSDEDRFHAGTSQVQGGGNQSEGAEQGAEKVRTGALGRQAPRPLTSPIHPSNLKNWVRGINQKKYSSSAGFTGD